MNTENYISAVDVSARRNKNKGEERWIPKLTDAEVTFIDRIFHNYMIMAAFNKILEKAVQRSSLQRFICLAFHNLTK